MIPKGLIDVDLEVTQDIETAKTYKLSKTNIQGYTDELKALEQAIYKEFNTEKYEYQIYSFNYGIDIESLLGKDSIYVKVELKRRIQERLQLDNRIENVDNFKFEINGDMMLCTFDVHSIYGDTNISKEVNI